MPHYCCVPKCKQKGSVSTTGEKVSFHLLPKETVRRKLWLNKIRRDEGKHFKITQCTRICSLHFLESDFWPGAASGRKLLKDDSVPSVFEWTKTSTLPRKPPAIRINLQTNKKKKNSSTLDNETSDEVQSEIMDTEPSSNDTEKPSSSKSKPMSFSLSLTVGAPQDSCHGSNNDCNQHVESDCINAYEISRLSEIIEKQKREILNLEQDNKGLREYILKQNESLKKLEENKKILDNTVADLERKLAYKSEDIRDLEKTISAHLKELNLLRFNYTKTLKQCDELDLALKRQVISIDSIKESATKVNFYTGIPNYEKLMDLYAFLNPGEKGENLKLWYSDQNEQPTNERIKGRPRKLKPINQFLLVMMRLRLGLFEQDLADRFGISISTVSRIIISWLNFMYVQLGQLGIWAPRDEIDKHMPEDFKQKYPSTRVIIDATEIKCETPSSFVLQSGTYSNYKSTNTFKGLVGISPDGTLTFVSSLYTGSISDKMITLKSGLLKKPFVAGYDTIMADKGFKIEDLLSPIKVGLNIPPFLKNNGQFSKSQIEESQKIASLRIHVERKIKRIRSFHIFDRPLPLSLAPVVNQVWTVCSLLTNFQSPIINSTPVDDLEPPLDEAFSFLDLDEEEELNLGSESE